MAALPRRIQPDELVTSHADLQEARARVRKTPAPSPPDEAQEHAPPDDETPSAMVIGWGTT